MENPLSPAQTAALFDILSHHNTYDEIRDFRNPGSFDNYGPPFTAEPKVPSTSPALQGLVSKFATTLPGLRDVPEDFWKVQVKQIIEAFELANLSESYDKGAIGSRRTIATAFSALLEYPVRGTSGGFPKVVDPNQEYDLSDSEDLIRGFRNFVDGFIYGNLLEELLEMTARTDNLEEHTTLTQALHEFMLVNIASFMHFILILSPKGQYLLKLLGNANKLVPYMVIRQTLKIGNVATMLSGMVRVVLAKLSVSSVTNWIGLTQHEDTGLNLLQQIISTVLNWDIKGLESRVGKIQADRQSPSESQLRCLQDYVTKTQREQEQIREQSKTASISIVTSILASSGQPADLSDEVHHLAHEYLSILLAVRDRKEIIRVLCKSNPDHLTTAIRSVVSAYEPVIRHIHNAVDLSDTLSDFQAFLQDLLKVGKIPAEGKDDESTIPTVGDFVLLLKKHQSSLHKFLHQCCKNGTELVGWYLAWAKSAATHFRQASSAQPASQLAAAGNLTGPLSDMFHQLPRETRDAFLPILDARSAYLDEMHASSRARLDDVLHSMPSSNPASVKVLSPSSTSGSRPSSRAPSRAPSPMNAMAVTSTVIPSSSTASVNAKATRYGPGAYLARWQDLLDNTALTPTTPGGPVAVAAEGGRGEEPRGSKDGGRDVGPVVEVLGQEFRRLLGGRSVYW